MDNKKTQQPIRIFKNPILESLIKTSGLVTFLVYVPVILFFLWMSSFKQISLAKGLFVFLSGVFSWTLLEYLLHRFVFHFIAESDISRRIHYILHGVHHHHPKNTDKLFMPPIPGLALIGTLYLIIGFFLGKYIFAFLPGMIAGYLMYVFLHYLIHTRRPPKYFKKVWSHHLLHHHKYSEHCFGVSTTLWDRVFKTMPPQNK